MSKYKVIMLPEVEQFVNDLVNVEYHGYTYWQLLAWEPVWWLWKLVFCRIGWHLWDEVVSSTPRDAGGWEHCLYCDACEEELALL